MSKRLSRYLRRQIKIVDRALDRYLPKITDTPKTVHRAMRYSVFAGGKRLRPILVMAAAEVCGGRSSAVLPTACATELIHAYSLIHDDLPAMDDDDLRRGQPTNHKVFGEGMAILAGDALLTHAFDLIAKNRDVPGISSNTVARVISAVASGAGTDGMIGGQVADILSEKGAWEKRKTRFEKMSPDRLLTYIHSRKTAALITASLVAGALLANAPKKKTKALQRYGLNLGLAFQVKDDLLDILGDKKKLGKRGSDRTNQKLTFPALYGIELSQKMLTHLIHQAHQALKPLGGKAAYLHDLADYVQNRDY